MRDVGIGSRLFAGALTILVLSTRALPSEALPAESATLPSEAVETDVATEVGHLLPEHGLSSATVYSLLQDRTGFLWLGTESGLSRYDGYAFETFRHDPEDSGSLSNDDISFILEAGDGMLWLATWGGGLSRFDPIARTFDHFRARPGGLPDDRVQVVIEDSMGVLWIGTHAGGLSRFDRASIRPPYWQTAWFRILWGLAVVSAAAVGYRLRIRTLTRREQELSRRLEAGLADLRRSEERYRLLFERNLAGVVRATSSGRILDCNQAFARVLGYDSVEECRQRHRLEPSTSPRGGSLLARLRENGRVIDHEALERTRDGSMVSLLWNASLIAEGDEPEVIEGTVILDLAMPRMSGEEAFREIRKVAPGTRVILASGYDEQKSTRLFAGLGLSGFIQKPYRIEALREKIRDVLGDTDREAREGQ